MILCMSFPNIPVSFFSYLLSCCAFTSTVHERIPQGLILLVCAINNSPDSLGLLCLGGEGFSLTSPESVIGR